MRNKFDLKTLADAYNSGKTCYELAAEYSSHPITISRFLRRNGIKLRKRGSKKGETISKIVNQTFGKIIVLRATDNRTKDRRTLWVCKCLYCNTLEELELRQVKTGKILNCKCPRDKSKHNGFGNITLTHWNSIKHCAEKRNISFEITIEDAWNQYIKQEGKCSLTGLKIDFACSNQNLTEFTTASLDRIDSTKSYTIDNIQWIHKDLQFMKWTFDEKYYIEMCKLVSNGPKKEYYDKRQETNINK